MTNIRSARQNGCGLRLVRLANFGVANAVRMNLPEAAVIGRFGMGRSLMAPGIHASALCALLALRLYQRQKYVKLNLRIGAVAAPIAARPLSSRFGLMPPKKRKIADILNEKAH